jgi:hypothetical protein
MLEILYRKPIVTDRDRSKVRLGLARWNRGVYNVIAIDPEAQILMSTRLATGDGPARPDHLAALWQHPHLDGCAIPIDALPTTTQPSQSIEWSLCR